MKQYRITLTATRISTYEAEIAAADEEEAQRIAEEMIPEDMTEIDDSTLDMSVEVEPVA